MRHITVPDDICGAAALVAEICAELTRQGMWFDCLYNVRSTGGREWVIEIRKDH
jgi:hypothetical protein